MSLIYERLRRLPTEDIVYALNKALEEMKKDLEVGDGNSRELVGNHLSSLELMETRRNSEEVIGILGRSREMMAADER